MAYKVTHFEDDRVEQIAADQVVESGEWLVFYKEQGNGSNSEVARMRQSGIKRVDVVAS